MYVIQNVEDNYLLNCISIDIETLIIIANNLVNFELVNLPPNIQNVTIIYKNFYEPSKFYEMYENKIKLPIDCKLKIIKYFEYSYYYKSTVDQGRRHLVIMDD
jgi:hypothetical protein